MIRAAEETDSTLIPRIPWGEWFEAGFEWFLDTFRAAINWVDDALEAASGSLADALAGPDALVLIVVFVLLAVLAKDWKLGLLTIPLMLFIVSVDKWEYTMDTLALVAVAVVIALLIAIPLGILAAKSQTVSSMLKPILDFMQTMPAFVWLIPTMFMFGLGMPAGIVATIIFALPPGVRLTELAIRQVDAEVVEAGNAFGATNWQILSRIQLPLATKTIMAGVNQVIMLALSMAVFGGLVGAGGLGGEVMAAMNTLDLGRGLEAGFCVVMIAVYLDRVTGALGSDGEGTLGRLLRKRKKPAGNHKPDPAKEAENEAASFKPI